jgi:hypothetical protein
MANTPINAMTATFGSGDQTAIKMNVSDAGPSNNSSKLIDLQLGSVTKFKVSKRGEVTATNYTGSFSGSIFIKNQSSDSGTKYLLFSNGSGQRTVGYDTSLSYDASSNTLTTNGSVNIGGDIDSTNGSPLLLSTPTTIGFGSSATTIRIGSSVVGGYTRFDSKQVRGNFTGSFTGSISGGYASFTNIYTDTWTANSFTGSISGGYASFTNISGGYVSITEITASNGRIENNLVVEGSLQLNNSITGSNNMFMSGAGSPIAGYVGIMIGGVKYKMPLYPWT